MITAIAIENFKGVGERIEIEFRPLTLLFGANSAGKSTVLHALHYAREIFERHNLDADHTLAGGTLVNLGGFEGFVHGRDRTRDISIRINMDITDRDLPTFDANFDELSRCGLMPPFTSFIRKPSTVSVEVTVSWSQLEWCPYVKATKIFFDGQKLLELNGHPDLSGVVLNADPFDNSFTHPLLTCFSEKDGDPENLLLRRLLGTSTLDPLDDHSGIPPTADIPFLERAMEHVCLGGELDIELNGRGDALLPLDRPLRLTPASNLPLSLADDLPWYDELQAKRFLSEFSLALSDLVIGPCQLCRDELRGFRYLGPLRETPPRKYQPPRYEDPSRWSSGLGAWDVLHSGSNEFVDLVDDWLSNRLGSGYGVTRRQFKEIDEEHPLIVSLLTGRALDKAGVGTRISLDDFPSVTRVEIVPDESLQLALSPHDVGIGISQVVPVVVTALYGDHKLVAIEQPELHLHPKLQAQMGDLFIEAACGKRKHQVLLETHSEHLILRLLRRIRETADAQLPGLPEGGNPLRPDDLAVYYIDKGPNGLRAVRLRVDETGEFIDRWPAGFFDEREQELF